MCVGRKLTGRHSEDGESSRVSSHAQHCFHSKSLLRELESNSLAFLNSSSARQNDRCSELRALGALPPAISPRGIRISALASPWLLPPPCLPDSCAPPISTPQGRSHPDLEESVFPHQAQSVDGMPRLTGNMESRGGNTLTPRPLGFPSCGMGP